MEAPDKIYIRTGMSGLFYGSKEKSFESDIEYIRKDLLLEWVKEERAKCSSETHPYAMFMNVVIDKLNSL